MTSPMLPEEKEREGGRSEGKMNTPFGVNPILLFPRHSALAPYSYTCHEVGHKLHDVCADAAALPDGVDDGGKARN